MGVHADSGIAAMALRMALFSGAATENRTPAVRQAHNTLRL
jgi:hypothetical protein